MAKKPKEPYTAQQLERAVTAVKRGMGVRKAATIFKVPKTTLYDNTRGKYRNRPKCQSGPGRRLGAAMEEAMVSYAIYMSERGFPLVRTALKALVRAAVLQMKKKTPFNLEKGPSDKWVRSFIKRHRDLTLRIADKLDDSRASLSQEEVDQYFTLLQKTIERHGLSPAQIFNTDETGFSGRETFRGKVVAKKGVKRVYQRPVKFPGHTTVLAAAAASGNVLPPL